MLKLLIGCLVLLLLLYCAKLSLLHLVVPSTTELSIGPEDAEGSSGEMPDADEGESPGSSNSDWRAAKHAFRRGNDVLALSHLQACIGEDVPGLAPVNLGAPRGEVSIADASPSDRPASSAMTPSNATASEKAACKALLGELRLVGAGAPRSTDDALALFEDAAQAGDSDAQFLLGTLYSAMHAPDEDPRTREALAVLHLYASSTAGHPGALMAMGYRHVHGYGVPKACTTAALNYIEVAKKIASVYSAGMPQAVELIRLNLHPRDRKVISSSEMNLFVQIATSGDTTVAAAIGKRYLLGIEGFRQDYRKAKHYLSLASKRNHAGALALLGYMHCLGLGTTANLDIAYSYFVSSSAQNDPLGHNGLGFIYFKGTTAQARNLRLAFRHFNESAYGGSSDGMFNLASMYLTGTGTDQSFQKAVLWYTQALDRGHTPAAYSLAVMHLNGIGTVRDCDIAVNLLKKVCERGSWVSGKLVAAYEHGEQQPDRSALLFLKLAEAGHEVAQMNVAHFLDSGHAWLLHPIPKEQNSAERDLQPDEEMRQHNRIVAQRYYEMSAEQGSASSELRLGDYAYYGWGISASFKEMETNAEADELTEEAEDIFQPSFGEEAELVVGPQPVDYSTSLVRYRKTAEIAVTGEWMQGFVARGSFNLGFMHQFGLGISQDLHLARRHYQRCREVDPGGVHAPVTLVLVLLSAHQFLMGLPSTEEMQARAMGDMRVHILVLHLVGIFVLLILRCTFRVPRRPPGGAVQIVAGRAGSNNTDVASSSPAGVTDSALGGDAAAASSADQSGLRQRPSSSQPSGGNLDMH